jgi:hypothetical protein
MTTVAPGHPTFPLVTGLVPTALPPTGRLTVTQGYVQVCRHGDSKDSIGRRLSSVARGVSQPRNRYSGRVNVTAPPGCADGGAASGDGNAEKAATQRSFLPSGVPAYANSRLPSVSALPR